MMQTRGFHRRTQLLLGLSFGGLAWLMVLVQLFSYFKAREVQTNVDLIAENALSSIKLVERMGMNIQRQRILIDEHIIEQGIVRMDQLERDLAVTKDDYADLARRYEPLVTFRGERQAWRRLMDDVAAIERPIDAILAFSRQNADVEARAGMAAIELRFATVEHDVDDLVEINQAEGDRALATVRQIQHGVASFRSLLSVLAACATVVVGVWVTRLVSRREDQVRQYAEALEHQNRELDAFAGRVAHDLRGPLTTISLSASRLAQRLPPAEGATDVLRRGVKRMEMLIEDLLKLSRIDAQTPGMVSQTDRVAASVEEDLGPKVKDAAGLLRIEIEPAQVRCSEGLLREVLWNLGENAVKYRRPDVQLRLELVGRAAQQGYEFRVSDNGAGMSAEEVRQAFDPFFRGEQARATPGTGLGLSIVKRIIEASGGTVAVESRVGTGTVFRFKLALANPAV